MAVFESRAMHKIKCNSRSYKPANLDAKKLEQNVNNNIHFLTWHLDPYFFFYFMFAMFEICFSS